MTMGGILTPMTSKPGHNGEEEYTLNMKSSWYYLVEELRRAQQRERTQSIQKRHDLQEVQHHLDWLPWRRLDKQSNTKVRTALQTWHQGNLHQDGRRTRRQTPPMPALWLCCRCNPLALAMQRDQPPFATELEQGINREFWAQGLVQRPPYQISTGGAAIQAWGSWTGLDEITLQPHDAITLLHHTLFGGEMYRMGAISTVLPGKQSVARAWYYGLRMIAHYVDLQSMVRVHVLSVKAWQGWVKGRHHETFHDLAELVTWDQRQRIRALSMTQQQINTMPGSEVWPIATLGLETQDHFMHGQKATGKEQRQKAREAKKHLYLEIGVTGHEGGHQWTSKGRGLQCRNCKKQIHQRMPMEMLKAAKDEACEVASGIPLTGGEAVAATAESTTLFISQPRIRG